MKRTVRAAWTGYFFFFLLVSLGGLVELLNPGSKPSLFYHTLMAFTRVGAFWYSYALMAAVLAFVSLWPLYVRAFALPRSAVNFFKWVFILRVTADLFGHRYEVLFFKAIWHVDPAAAAVSAVIALLLVFPSYRALYEHVIKK